MDWLDDVEVRIRREFAMDMLEIYIFQGSGRDVHLAHWRLLSTEKDADCELIFEPFERFTPVDRQGGPTMRLPRPLGDIFLRAMSEFAMSEGIKPVRHEKLEGVLDAQGKHLSNVRRLLGGVMEIPLDQNGSKSEE